MTLWDMFIVHIFVVFLILGIMTFYCHYNLELSHRRHVIDQIRYRGWVLTFKLWFIYFLYYVFQVWVGINNIFIMHVFFSTSPHHTLPLFLGVKLLVPDYYSKFTVLWVALTPSTSVYHLLEIACSKYPIIVFKL